MGCLLFTMELLSCRSSKVISSAMPPMSRKSDVHRRCPMDQSVLCDPTVSEKITRAVSQLKSGKAPGSCGIYAEMLKAERAAALLWCTLCSVPFGTRRSFQTFVQRDVLALLFDRVRLKLPTQQRLEQSSFTSKCPQISHMLDLGSELMAAYVDLRKAFDSVNGDVL